MGVSELPVNWRDKAACKDADPAVFFDDHVAAAIRICHTCEVVRPCLEYALTRFSKGYDSGVWGATTPATRERLRRERRQRAG